VRALRAPFVLASAGLCVAFLACGSRLDPRLVQRWAANDFNCDESLIVIDDIGDEGRYTVHGCEQRAHYVCGRVDADHIRCVPERTVASNSPASVDYVPSSGSGCNCGSFGSHDPPAAQSPTTPVMPQKPYR
jgi:hypothetical protein